MTKFIVRARTNTGWHRIETIAHYDFKGDVGKAEKAAIKLAAACRARKGVLEVDVERIDAPPNCS